MATEPVLEEILAYLSRRPAYADIVLALPPGTLDAEPGYITDFLDFVDETHGGVRSWLTGPAGIPSETIERLQQVFVDRNY
jgi:hypothetical protein